MSIEPAPSMPPPEAAPAEAPAPPPEGAPAEAPEPAGEVVAAASTNGDAGNGLTPPSLTGAGRRFLSDLIVELGFVDADTVAAAVEAARRPGMTVEKVLLDQSKLSEDQLARALAERYGLDHIDLTAYDIDRSAAGLLQEGPARRYRAVPVGFSGDGSLLVAVADPSDSLGLSDIAVMTKLAVRPAVAARTQIEALIDELDFMEEPVRPAPQTLGTLIVPPSEEEGEASASAVALPTMALPDPGSSARTEELEAELRAERARLTELETELSAERERLTAELAALRDGGERALAAERERHAAELESERGRLTGERDRLANDLEAERTRLTAGAERRPRAPLDRAGGAARQPGGRRGPGGGQGR